MKKTQPMWTVAIDGSNKTEQEDLWLRTVTTQSDDKAMVIPLATRGPAYKVDIVVDKMKT